ncbi:AmmeMemoRadiSam system protein A [Deferribacteraceae bacterium V6Fe1]|nr:AmmeMemoRadiSam system protein A [Deferribacteraceae bacterium V6Fe1]
MNVDFNLTKKDKIFLLKVARESIQSKLNDTYFNVQNIPDSLKFNSGCFVTLHLDGMLRGCIGNFREDVNIVENVAEMAVSAAFSDPRFPAVADIDELRQCEIEISVLSPMIPCSPEDIVVGRDGIYIRKGYYSGVLLPQVATEHNFDRETFLTHTCYKAGLSGDCWKQPDVKIYRFEAVVFSEDILN